MRIAIGAAALGWLAAVSAAAAAPLAMTTEGPVQGVTSGSVNNFLGIRYAAPPVGPLRWTPPAAPPSHLGSTVTATAYGSYCPQGESEIGPGGGSEDCLFLNVQTPSSATPSSNLPVFVWIHGGGLTTGSGQEYDGSALVSEGNVVFVSFNYRLGLLGFLAHPALAMNGSSGNYGLEDQQAAIAWVRANAAAFGGNPNNITIAGESAGGESVIDQLAAPKKLGRIHAAIVESGAYMRRYDTQAAAATTGQSIATMLGCTDQSATCLRNLPVSALINLVGAGIVSTSGITIRPNIDGSVLPMNPYQAFQSGQFARVPVIDGTNHDEARLFVSENDLVGSGPVTALQYPPLAESYGGLNTLLQYPLSAYPSPDYAVSSLTTDYDFSCGAILLNAVLAPYVPVYAYELNDPNVPNIFLPPDPNLALGDSHAAELPYLFPSFRNTLLGLGPAAFSPAQLQLARTMRANWTSFARYGRPLSPAGGIWPHYTLTAHPILSLVSPSPATETGFIANHQCDYWMPMLITEAGVTGSTPY